MLRLLDASADELKCADFGLRLSHWQGLGILGPGAVIARNAETVQDGMAEVARFLYVHSEPGFLLAKLALDRSLQGDKDAMWGTQLVVGALRRIVEAANVSGGRVIIVDADNERLVPFYASHSFLPTRVHSLRLYMKVATARKLIEHYETR